MKLVSLFVALCFTMNVFASTGGAKAFEAALDEYHYAVSVEWDQKDVKFHEAKTKELFDKMQALITEGAINQKEINEVIEKKINNKATVDLLKLKMSLAGDFQSPEDLANFMRESSKELYSQGASWNGYVVIPVAVVLTAVVALGFAMWYSATHGCQEYAQTCDQFGCRNNYDVCLDYGYVGPHL